MKVFGRLALIGVVLLAGNQAGAQNLQTIYEHDFDTPVGPEWSHNVRTTTPNAVRTFLGRFSDDHVMLNLDFIPEHCAVTVDFDLLIIGEWDGSVGPFAGPDLLDINASIPGDCCPLENLLHATFAHCDCTYQAYPGTYPNAYHPGTTGAEEIDTLGYEMDSVYHLSFTFFHHQERLQLSFSGSSNLEPWPDETWGIDNIVVSIDNDSCCRGERKLPAMFNPGTALDVAIDVNPNPGAQACVVEEEPPAGLSVSNINEGGSLDPVTGTIKWGPFFGNQARTLLYTVAVPAGTTADMEFDGAVSIDGETEATCGDDTVVAGAFHPADVDADWSISGAEATAYAAAWRLGEEWAIPPAVIPSPFVTNAGMIWREGETYDFVDGVTPPWVPTGGAKAAGGGLEILSGSRVFSADSIVTLTLEIRPAEGTRSFAVEQILPQGWSVVEPGDGFHDEASGTLRFGPFYGDAPRSARVVLRSPVEAPSSVTFTATGFFDGVDVPAEGVWMVLSGGIALPEDSRTE